MDVYRSVGLRREPTMSGDQRDFEVTKPFIRVKLSIYAYSLGTIKLLRLGRHCGDGRAVVRLCESLVLSSWL